VTVDDLNLLRDLGRALDREPPKTLVRQRSRLARAEPRRRRPGPLVIVAAALATAALVLVPALLKQNRAAKTTDRPGTAKAPTRSSSSICPPSAAASRS
jgi:hypothetical protein